ncbi:MAG: hypothetical protein ACI3Y7_05010 [Candidatus Cryptobacteroides sp.]
MKKTLILVCAAALALVGCQKQLSPEQVSEPASSSSIEAYALPSASSKAVYEENATGALAGKWEVGDVIFGLNGSTPFQFEVSAVDAEGKATLNQTTEVAFAAGDVLQAAFCPGKTAADLSGGSFALDLSEQAADVVPVLLLSKATVAEGPVVNFAFTNATSVVALKAPVFPAAISEGKAIKNVTLSGHEIVSSGVVSVVGDEFVFTPDAPCNFIRKSVSIAAVDVDGTSYKIDEPVYIVIPAAGKISKISALDNKNGFFTYDLSGSAVGTAAPEASKYYTLSAKTFTKVTLPVSSGIKIGTTEWADRNLGAAKSSDMGDIYRWSDTELIYTEKTASTITFDANHPNGFTPVTGESYCTDAAANSNKGQYNKYLEAGYVLEPVDDVVQITYPGTGWRMAKQSEFITLVETVTAAESGYTVTDTENSAYKIVLDADPEITLSFRCNQLVSHSSSGTTLSTSYGRYWTSETYTGNYHGTYYAFKYTSSVGKIVPAKGSQARHFGYSVRPVKTVE